MMAVSKKNAFTWIGMPNNLKVMSISAPRRSPLT